MSQRRALVTGTTGFVGSHLTRRLLEDGWKVTAVVRKAGSLPPGVGEIVYDGNIHTLIAAVKAAQPEVCFHVAGLVNSGHTVDDVDLLLNANIEFGTHLLEALRPLVSIEFVNVGTFWQHFEGREYSAVSLYAATKQAFQAIVQFYAETSAIRSVTVELPYIYGPGETRKRLVALLVENLGTDKTLELSPGDQLFDVVHVDDVVEALLAAVPLASHDAPVFGVGDEEPPTLKEFAAEVSALLGMKNQIEWGARPYHQREMMTPWLATPILPGWKRQVSLETGLQSMLDDDQLERTKS